jgi:hypothetical protein
MTPLILGSSKSSLDQITLFSGAPKWSLAKNYRRCNIEDQ